MSEQYTITVPIRIADGVWIYPRVGEMSAIRQTKTREIIYDIALDFPVDTTEFLAFAKGSDAIEADEHARAPLSTSRLLAHVMRCQSNDACDALPVRRSLQASPAEAVNDPARADDPANTGPLPRPAVFPLRQHPSAKRAVDSTTDNNAEGDQP